MATHVLDTGKDRERSAFDELTEIAHRIQTFANASGAAIGLRVGTTEEIVCCARTGPSARDVGSIMGVAGSFAGLCIKSGKGLLSDDTETDTRVDLVAVRALGIRSIVVTPVKENNQVVAVLAVFSPFPSAFNSVHLAVMKTSADQIAAFLRKSRQTAEDEYEHAPVQAPVAVPKDLPAPAETVAPPRAVVPPAAMVPPVAVVHQVIEHVPPAKPAVAVPVAVKVTVVDSPSPISAPIEVSKPVRDMPLKAVENSAAFWSGGASAAAAVAPAHKADSVTTVLAEEVKPAISLPPRIARSEKQKKEQGSAKHYHDSPILSSVPEQNNKSRTGLILGSVAAVAIIAGGAFAFMKFHNAAPRTAPQHVQEASGQPAPVQPAPVQPAAESAGNTGNSQPSLPPVNAGVATKNPTPPSPAANTSAPASTNAAAGNNASSASATQISSADSAKKSAKTEKSSAAQPEKRAPETVALANGSSKINGARPSDSGQQDAAPALSVGGAPALGNLSSLSDSTGSPKPSLVAESKVEPIETIKSVNPAYPSIARARGLKGAEVVVSVRVGKDGKASNIRLISGNPIFLDAVTAAVKQWQFKPARLNGQPIEQEHQIKFRFN
jgi:TonB family protein